MSPSQSVTTAKVVNFFVQAKTSTVTKANNFFALDWVIMILYMIAIVGIGVYFFWDSKRSKQSSSGDYLVAKNSKIPSVVIGLSIWATALSSLTFLGLPGLAFKTGWQWSVSQIAVIAVSPILIKWVIPFYRRLKDSTAYAYLERRFNYSLRAIGSLFFIIFHIFRMAIVLLIPALTLTLFVDVNIYLLLFIVATAVVASTFLGGFRGVVWTDAIQGLIFLIGIGFVIIFGLVGTDFSKAQIQQIFTKNQWKINAASGGIFFIFIARYIESIFSYTASQDIVQRYKASKSISKINKSIYINIFLSVITILVFYGAGSMLYSYYSSQGFDVNAENAIDTIVGQKKAANNQLLAFFIINVLPMGISGLLIAAVFAASQSTISSSLNSTVTAIVIDFVNRWVKVSDRKLLWLSKILTIIFGVLAFGVSCILAVANLTNLVLAFLGIVGLLGAPLAGVFILGIMTKRSNWIGALIGISSGFIVAFPLWLFSGNLLPENLKIVFNEAYLVLVSFSTTLIIGYCSSLIAKLILPNLQIKSQTNITIFTQTVEFKKLLKAEKTLSKVDKLFRKKRINESKRDNYYKDFDILEKIVALQK